MVVKRLFNVLNTVKNIDVAYKSLSATPESKKIVVLLEQINGKPEIQTILTKFLKDLNDIGINQTGSRLENRMKYYTRLLKFYQLHSVFWDLCKTRDISQHNHRLGWDYNNIGLLDPKNFSAKDYEQILRGFKDQEGNK